MVSDMSHVAEIAEKMKQMLNGIADDFNVPDDDFFPMLVLVNGEKMNIAMIHPDLMSSDDAKDALGYAVMPGLLKKECADAFVFVSSTWTVETNDLRRFGEWRRENEGVSLEHFPGRVERVFMFASDGVEDVVFAADIERDNENPPVVGEWISLDDFSVFQSRMIGPLKAALADIRKERVSGEEED